MSDEFARANQRLGRSYGCPALPNEIAPQVITKIHDGHCLFIYAKQPNYLASSHWLRRKPDGLHDDMPSMALVSNTVTYDDNEKCESTLTAQVETPSGVDVKRIVLSPEEVKRLGISKDKIQRQ